MLRNRSYITEDSEIKSIDASFIRNARKFVLNWLNQIKHFDSGKISNNTYLYSSHVLDLVDMVTKFDEYISIEKGFYGYSKEKRDLRDYIKLNLFKVRTVYLKLLTSYAWEIGKKLNGGKIKQDVANSLFYNKAKESLVVLFKTFGSLGRKNQDTDYGRLERKFSIGNMTVNVLLPVFDRHSRDSSTYDVKESIEVIVDSLLHVRQLLKNLKLDIVWYGSLSAMDSKHPSINIGYNVSNSSAAMYNRKNDSITVLFDRESGHLFSGLDRYTYSIVHELGHRYWYKFMSNEKKDQFSKWFSSIKSVTDYGGTKPEEDFAETFAHYVLKMEMTKEQIERFRQIVLASGSANIQKLESKVNEEAYPGNIGFVEMMKFYKTATGKDINKMETFLKKGYKDKAMILLQKITGTKLYRR